MSDFLSLPGFSRFMTIHDALFFLSPLAQQAPAGGGLGQFLPIILLFVGMWFLIIAPQRKRQKQHEQMLRDLKSGEKVVTNGGIFGVITNVKDDRFVIRIADNTKIEVGKSFIHSKLAEPSETKAD